MSEPIRIDSGLRADDDGPEVHPILAAPQPSERGASPLEALRATLAKPVERELLRLRVPARAGVTVLFSPDFDHEKRKAWQKRATRKSRRPGREDEVDEMLFALIVIANCARAIQMDGVEAHDASGQPLTFASPVLWEMVSAADPQDAIRAFYGNDAHILTTAGEIMLAAGFDDDVDAEEEVDPTAAS